MIDHSADYGHPYPKYRYPGHPLSTPDGWDEYGCRGWEWSCSTREDEQEIAQTLLVVGDVAALFGVEHLNIS